MLLSLAREEGSFEIVFLHCIGLCFVNVGAASGPVLTNSYYLVIVFLCFPRELVIMQNWTSTL